MRIVSLVFVLAFMVIFPDIMGIQPPEEPTPTPTETVRMVSPTATVYVQAAPTQETSSEGYPAPMPTEESQDGYPAPNPTATITPVKVEFTPNPNPPPTATPPMPSG